MRFDSFVVFAGMRTGSNYLEANLNALDGVRCHGEAFNPHFIAYPNRSEVLGVTKAARDADPVMLLDAIRAEAGVLGGFRFFHDHDPRILPRVLADPGCAKIILTRNPIDSYVSHRIAAATGQWKLTNVKHARSEKVTFDARGFERHLRDTQDFQLLLQRALQETGQTAFYIGYDDLGDLGVINGLATFLGVAARLERLDSSLKKQNPEGLDEKVVNFTEMEAALARLDRFDLSRTPNFEPRRGPAVPTHLAARTAPLLYLPIRGGPEAGIAAWMTALDGGAAPEGGFTQKSLRTWMADRPGHRAFTVLRHPVQRAHAAFCDKILSRGPGTYAEIRANLNRTFGLSLPSDPEDPAYDADAHRAAFLGFLRFLKANLGGQTGMRVDALWASQTSVLQGFADFRAPDRLIREEDLALSLAELAAEVGRPLAPVPGEDDPHAGRLAEIYDGEIEATARDAYARDYLTLGFRDWTGGAGA
jgi:LPS sulfotransferase NodH